jgi:hypothetical protein
MKSGSPARLLAVAVLAASTAGCSVAAGIFKAGFWAGIILAVVLVVAVMMLFRGRR